VGSGSLGYLFESAQAGVRPAKPVLRDAPEGGDGIAVLFGPPCSTLREPAEGGCAVLLYECPQRERTTSWPSTQADGGGGLG